MEKQRPKSILALGLMVSLVFYQCNTTSKTTIDKPVFSEEYYLQFHAIETKVAQLMCGRFSCYRASDGALFEVNEGKDSIVMYTVLVGDPHKDGTWIYKEGVLSHLPDKPLTQLFQKIEREAPDSLTIYEYRPKERSNAYIGYYQKARTARDFDLKDLVSTGCAASIKKVHTTKFECRLDMCPRNKGEQECWIDLTAVYDPSGVQLQSTKYKTPERSKKNVTTRSALFYKRLAALE